MDDPTNNSDNVKQYRVPVSWVIVASTVVEAENKEEAEGLADCLDLDLFDDQEYQQGSFEIDWENIEEIDTSSTESLPGTTIV